MIKRIQRNMVLEVNFRIFATKIAVLPREWARIMSTFCFVVVYQDSKTSPDAIVDYVFNDSIFLLRAGSTRFFINLLPIHQSNESNARIFEHRSPTAFPLSLFLFFGQRMHSRLCN